MVILFAKAKLLKGVLYTKNSEIFIHVARRCLSVHPVENANQIERAWTGVTSSPQRRRWVAGDANRYKAGLPKLQR